jgi:hypothetical protein
LQILGVLETRNLDFKRIVFLSLNEGKLPGGKNDVSLIPFQIKKHFKLPTYQEKDAVFSYHFYRLLQRAEEIHLVYYENEADGKAEKSRFILQLEWELPQKNPNAKIQHYVAELSETAIEKRVIPEIEKNEYVVQLILNYFSDPKKGASPSALSTFITCSLNFYYQHLLGIRETEEVMEDAEVSVLGNVVHKVLQEAYHNFTGKDLNQEKLNIPENQIEKWVIEAFKHQRFDEQQIKKGQNLLQYETALKMINDVITFDRKRLKNNERFSIVALEKKLQTSLIYKNQTPIYFKGNADRIEQNENGIQIIDYKTGKFEESTLNVTKMSDLFKEKNRYAFQLMMYVWMYSKMHPGQEKIRAGIISSLQIRKGIVPLRIEKSEYITKEVVNSFEELLVQNVIDEIFNTEKPFSHSESSKYCLCLSL